MMRYYIKPKEMCHVDKIWEQEFRRQYCCSECGEILPEFQKVGHDVYLDEKPSISAVSSLSETSMCIARVDFLRLFLEEVNQYLKLGNVYYRNKRLDNMVSVIGYPRMAFRGEAEYSEYGGPCEVCGQLDYYASYPWYVLKRDISERPICCAWPFRGLIIEEELCKRIERKCWKGIHVIPLKVLDEPLDGFDFAPAKPLI